jgi:hypothetical protein
MKKKTYIVGCGGIGGWVANALAKTLDRNNELVLVDGDKLEKKNLDRQLFDAEDTGKYKAEAMAEKLASGARCTVTAMPEYLGADPGFRFDRKTAAVIVGADNHVARATALRLCDETRTLCVSAANGYEDAEAFAYQPKWKGTPLDPRVYYPELLTDTSDNPLEPPCTGEILESQPQLAIANMCAASYAMWLLWFWNTKAATLPEEVAGTFPVHVISTAGRKRTRTVADIMEG